MKVNALFMILGKLDFSELGKVLCHKITTRWQQLTITLTRLSHKFKELPHLFTTSSSETVFTPHGVFLPVVYSTVVQH